MIRNALPWITAVLLCLVAAKGPAAEPGKELARRYGIDGWDKVERITFTFNVEFPGRSIARRWVWEPQEGRVHYAGPGADGDGSISLSYLRSELTDEGEDSELLRTIDHRFINDSYWLLFPYYLVWAEGVEVTESAEPQSYPIGDGEGRKLVAAFREEGGYTPGDAYALYLGEDGLIRQWEFMRGGDPENASAMTWEDHREIGPLIIAHDHYSADRTRRLFFTDVTVKFVAEKAKTSEQAPTAPATRPTTRPANP